MKLADINAIGGVLSALRINCIKDKGAKDAVSDSFLSVRKALRPFEKDKDELVEKFRSDWKDEIRTILSKKEGGHEAYYAAERDLNGAILKMLDEREADVTFSHVKADILYSPELWGDKITLGEIDDMVSFLVKHGVAEE